MKTGIFPALVASSLISFVAAIPSLQSRAIQRRNDAPPLPPCPSNNYTPYTYVGCFYEPNPETLQYSPNLVFSTMTVEACTATCKSNGFRYAGLVYFGTCLCGTILPPSPAPEADCNAPCNGNPNEMCGANQRISVYLDPTYPAVDLSTIVSQYAPLGCYTETQGVGYRAVSYRQDQLSSSSLTTEACLTACGNEYYPLAATEFGGECYCGYMLQGGSAPAPSTDCAMACNGDSTEICGGPSRLNLYEAKILESTRPCGSNPPPPPSTCSGTAYGYATSGGTDKTFISLGIGKNWGWVITGSTPISGTLYLGAGGNDISKATAVGTFTIAHVGSNLVVTFTTQAPWYLSTTHFYYGSAPPSKIAPGQFGNKHDGLPAGATTDTYSIPFDASKTTYIVHAGIAYAC